MLVFFIGFSKVVIVKYIVVGTMVQLIFNYFVLFNNTLDIVC